MLVFRIEQSDGSGPYNPEFTTVDIVALSNLLAESHKESDFHPSLFRDFREMTIVKIIQRGYIFGFASMEDLGEWFDGWKDLLAEYGFYIQVFEISGHRVEFGSRQIAFPREHAQEVKRVSLV